MNDKQKDLPELFVFKIYFPDDTVNCCITDETHKFYQNAAQDAEIQLAAYTHLKGGQKILVSLKKENVLSTILYLEMASPKKEEKKTTTHPFAEAIGVDEKVMHKFDSEEATKLQKEMQLMIKDLKVGLSREFASQYKDILQAMQQLKHEANMVDFGNDEENMVENTSELHPE